jgi:hypothetical protein
VTTRRPTSTGLFDALCREWRLLGSDRAAASRLPDACRAAGGARTLQAVESYVHGSGPAEADRVLLSLVGHAVRKVPPNDLAARALLQLLLPGTRNLARRWWALGDTEERAAAAVAAVYGRIRNYPLERRPGRVAANILMDAAQDMRRHVPSADVTLKDPTTTDWLTDPPGLASAPMNPALELFEVLADAVSHGLLAVSDAQLIARTRSGGHRIEDIADSHELTARTLWARRKRAESSLASGVGRLALRQLPSVG